MKDKYRTGIAEFISRPYIYLAGWLMIIIFNTVISPFFPGWMGYDKPEIPKPLDLYFSYNVRQVHTVFTELGTKGREIYATFERNLDIPYLILYSLIYMTTLYKLTGRKNTYKWMLFPPLLIGFFDLMENVGILTMLNHYPVIEESKVRFTSMMTTLKWIFALLTFILVIYMIYRRVVDKFKPKTS